MTKISIKLKKYEFRASRHKKLTLIRDAEFVLGLRGESC